MFRPGKANLALAGEELPPFIVEFLRQHATRAERIRAMAQALRSPAAPMIRAGMGKQIVAILSVLIPEKYVHWRTLVQDAMMFVQSHLSVERLAPKLVEQLELPRRTPPERRLLRLIAKVPGLQKLGQVLARNRHLAPSLRRALAELENGIKDAGGEEIRALVQAELGTRLREYKVRVARGVFSEASVSAVVRFTWWNSESRRRERGVFKVLKPHIPACYAEDMELLQGLAEFLAGQHGRYGIPARGLADTFTQVRRLLQHEVNFSREQQTLERAQELYGGLRGVRVPRVIRALCTPMITAISEERGVKITDAAAQMSGVARARVADQLIDTLIGVPLLSAQERTMFHADPHAGNLLYDRESGELVVLDWALTESLSREQRRHLAMLVVMLVLRDRERICRHIQALSRRRIAPGSRQERLICREAERALRETPLLGLPGVLDAIRLLERIGFSGVRLPAPLILLRKVMFTLEGIVHEIAPQASMEGILARSILRRWISDWRNVGEPLALRDWIEVQASAVWYGVRVALRLTPWAVAGA